MNSFAGQGKQKVKKKLLHSLRVSTTLEINMIMLDIILSQYSVSMLYVLGAPGSNAPGRQATESGSDADPKVY